MKNFALALFLPLLLPLAASALPIKADPATPGAYPVEWNANGKFDL